MWMLTMVYPIGELSALGISSALMKNTKEIKGGEDEAGEKYPVRVVGSVVSREIGFQAAEPVFNMSFLVEH